MPVFITGATGYIGQKLALHLAAQGEIIHVLVRNALQARTKLDHHNIRIFAGDVLEKSTIKKASHGCTQAYHLAALASVWHRDERMFYRVNVGGLKNVLDTCLENGIGDVVFTSSAAVVGHSVQGELSNENPAIKLILETPYERSKVKAEELIKSYAKTSIRVVTVNPSRVYGPGLLTESNSTSRLVQLYLSGKWHVLPGNGQSMGNYAFIDDVVQGHTAAMKYGCSGERYLLGGENISYVDFFQLVETLSDSHFPLYNIPLSAMLVAAHIQVIKAKLTGTKPLISPSFVRKYAKNWMVDSGKAVRELQYKITPLKKGLSETITWLRSLA